MVEALLRRVRTLHRTRTSSGAARNARTAREFNVGELTSGSPANGCRNQRVFLEAKMLKKLMISAAVSALMVLGALAQASPPAKSDAAPVDAAKFISSQSTDQWVFSRFKGTNVLGPDDAKVGDVNDMLLDKSGKIIGL